jgi:hypothetical protein
VAAVGHGDVHAHVLVGCIGRGEAEGVDPALELVVDDAGREALKVVGDGFDGDHDGADRGDGEGMEADVGADVEESPVGVGCEQVYQAEMKVGFPHS